MRIYFIVIGVAMGAVVLHHLWHAIESFEEEPWTGEHPRANPRERNLPRNRLARHNQIRQKFAEQHWNDVHNWRQ